MVSVFFFLLIPLQHLFIIYPCFHLFCASHVSPQSLLFSGQSIAIFPATVRSQANSQLLRSLHGGFYFISLCWDKMMRWRS
ncbi:hypothetical protein L6452_14684 [Arctium lappa]|uniref:Uncharacterized protein n=1 Tax=Arctium lappa TaxID=4217 RepID=A0ACB9CLJ4_ARCLA|nr:hypothetical protein L6452_14684 [Arctium lappa]